MGVEFDNRTLLVVAGFAAAVQTAALFYVWRYQLRERCVGLLSLGYGLIALATVLQAARPMLHPILTIIGGNAGLVGGLAVISLAICTFTGRALSVAFPAGLAAFTAAIFSVFTFASPDIGIRIVLASLLVGLSLLPAILALLSTPPGPLRQTYWPVGILLSLHSLFALARGIATIIGGAPRDFFASSAVTSAWLFESFAMINLVALGLILMIGQRRRMAFDRLAGGYQPAGATQQPTKADGGDHGHRVEATAQG